MTEWYNEYMWCMEREGDHNFKFPEKYGNGPALMDGSEDYLVYKGDCSSSGCSGRQDFNGNQCDDKRTNDLDAFWHSFKCN